ncbi:MAG TPA: cytochrome c oxidase subunit 3 [Anaerolineales bacterium]|jgi:cytochrome c oxidase subunit 3|nr:cytochrome c oxidase subunit 3 [Anaerolineales bacterium]HRK89108.1 cytochrome c oxidase subunit 3 [Anaerolineales bacterium]
MTHSQNKSSALMQGVVIFVYLAVLTVIEYFIAVAFDAVPLLIVVAVIKAGLVVYYYMHIYQLNADDGDDEHSYRYKTGTNRIGLWLFLLSDAFVFAGLMVMRANLLGMTRPHLNQTLGLVVTAVLLVSSFFMNRGETAMKHGDVKAFMNNTLVTFVLGLGFFLGVVFVEWRIAAHEGLTASFGNPSVGPVGGVFYMMTGMHAFHVLTGLIFLGVVWNNARKGVYSAEQHWGVEAAAVYWHFVDLVWIFFYPALYLIGTAV